MRKVVIGALLASLCSPVLAKPVLNGVFRTQCEKAGYVWVENFDINYVYPLSLGTSFLFPAVYFGNSDSGDFYQLFVDDSSPDSIRTVQSLASMVNAGLAVDKTLDLCISQSTNPNSVMAINYVKETASG